MAGYALGGRGAASAHFLRGASVPMSDEVFEPHRFETRRRPVPNRLTGERAVLMAQVSE